MTTEDFDKKLEDMRRRMETTKEMMMVMEAPGPSDGDQPSYLQELTWKVAYDSLYESAEHKRDLQEVIAETIDDVLQAETARLVEEGQCKPDGVRLCLRLLMGMRSYPDAQLVNSLIPSRADWRGALRSAAYVLLYECVVEEIKTRLLQAQPLSDWLAWREYCNAAADIQEEDKDQ